MNLLPRAISSIGLAVATSICGTAPAQLYDPPWNVDLVGQIGGECQAVYVGGHYAYVGEGADLTILNASSSSSPYPAGRISLGDFQVMDIHVRDGLAYIAGASMAGDHGLQIVDVADPRSPRVRSSYPTPFTAYGVYVTDGLAYLACGSDRWSPGGVFIIDVSDPSSPTLRGSFDLAVRAWHLHVSDGIAYVAGSDGLYVLDVTNPSLPTSLAVYDQYYSNDVFVSGGLAYTATGNGLEIIDVTSPTAPTRRGRLLAGDAYALFLSDGHVFLAQDGSHEMKIVDVKNPSSPTLVSSYGTKGWPWDVAVSSGTAYLSDWSGGLLIVDVTAPSSPTLRSSYDTLSDARDIHVAGGVAYVANGIRGLKTVDVSNPRSPKVLGSLATPSEASRIAVSDGLAYICGSYGPHNDDIRGLLQIVDVTVPSSPRWLSSYDMATSYVAITDIAVFGSLAYITYIAGGPTGFQIVEVTDLSSPTFRGEYETPVLAMDVAVSGHLAFIADYSSVQIVDVSDPTLPFLRSSFPADRWRRIYDVFVSDGVLYMTGVRAATGANFACVDVTDPDAPAILGTYNVTGYTGESGGLYVSNGMAYVILDGLRVLDVRNPISPTLRGFYPTGSTSYSFEDLFGCGNLVYLTDFAGLRIFQFTGGGAATGGSWPVYK